MISSLFSSTRRPWGALFLGLFLVLVSGSAWAAGRVIWKSTTVKERTDGGSWRLDIEMHLASAPDIGQVPMKFEFVPTAYYERSLADGQDKPQERTVPLTNQQPLIESVDVGFMDSGSGQIQARTKFTFKVTRAHGYEAGEYKVTIRDSRNGQSIGTPTTLKFQGENEVIDRRSMVFQPSDRKKKEEPKKEAAPSEAPAEAAPSEAAPSSDAPPPAEEGDAPPPVEERPGGGCQVGGAPGAAASWLFSALLIAGFAVSRRARRHA